MAKPVKLSLVFDPQALRWADERAVTLIVERIAQAGQGSDGAPLAPYSTKTFAGTVGGIPKGVLRRLDADGRLKWFRTGRGTLMVAIEGGYAAYERARFPQDDGRVNLTATGAMLRALRVIQVDAKRGTVTIGFSRLEEARNASWHEKTGAGPNRTLRRLMGLTEADKGEVGAIAGAGVSVRVG